MPTGFYVRKQKDISGQKFNMLTAIRFVEKRDKGNYWLFRCDCGNEKVIAKSSVTSLLQKSCGCLHILSRKRNRISAKCREANIARLTSHGMSRTRIYGIWHSMKSRCYNYNTINYSKYGGSGVSVSDSWLIFENFRDDMYESYLEHVEVYGERNTTLDRIDSNGNYCMENCRWSTYKEQNLNRTFKKPQRSQSQVIPGQTA